MKITDEIIEAGQQATIDAGYDSDLAGELDLESIFLAICLTPLSEC